MKQLTLFVAALMLVGTSFAGGKNCCKKKGEKCSKEASSCCKKKGAEKDAPKKDAPKEAK